MPTMGRMTEIKGKLMEWISESNVSLQPESTHVFGEWWLAMDYLYQGTTIPIISCRVSPERIWEAQYGRKQKGTTGSMVTHSFSVHVHASNCTVSGHEKAEYAQKVADDIIDYISHKRDMTYGIADIYDMTARESEMVRGPKNISRIIIEGSIEAVRPDT